MTVVRLTFFDLRRAIAARPDIFTQFIKFADGCVVEVGHFKIELLVYQNVLTLQIQMSHFLSTKMLKHINHLMEEESASDFPHVSKLLVKTAEVSTGDILKLQVDSVLDFLAR